MYSTCVSSKLCEFILFDLSNFPLLGISSHLLQRWLGLLCSSCAAGRFLPRLLCNSFHWKLLPSGHCLVSSLCFPEEMMFLACLTLSVSTSLKCSLYSAPPEWIALVVLLLLCIALGLHHIWWETPLVRTGSRDPWQLLNAMGKMQILVLAVLRIHLEILPRSGLGFLSSAATTNISCSLASNKGEYKEHLRLKLPILALLTICERLALVAGNPSTLLCYISRSSKSNQSKYSTGWWPPICGNFKGPVLMNRRSKMGRSTVTWTRELERRRTARQVEPRWMEELWWEGSEFVNIKISISNISAFSGREGRFARSRGPCVYSREC